MGEGTHSRDKASDEHALVAVTIKECLALRDEIRMAVDWPAFEDILIVAMTDPEGEPIAEDGADDGFPQAAARGSRHRWERAR